MFRIQISLVEIGKQQLGSHFHALVYNTLKMAEIKAVELHHNVMSS